MNPRVILVAIPIIILAFALIAFSSSQNSQIVQTIATQTNVTTEVSATCPIRQYATGENASGYFQCGSASNTNYLTTQTAVSTEAVATCPTMQYPFNESASGIFNCNSFSQDYHFALTAYYPLDIVSSGTTIDVSGYTQTGTLVNSPKLFTGSNAFIGNSLNFTASKNQEVTMTLKSFNSTGVSIFAWVYISAYTTGHEPMVFSSGGCTKNDLSFRLNEISGTAAYPAYAAPCAYGQFDSTISVPLNTWTFVGMSLFNNTKLVLYTNTQSVTINSGASTLCTCYNSPSATSWSIGSDVGRSDYFSGRIDEVRLYSFALTPQEENNLYNYYLNVRNGI